MIPYRKRILIPTDGSDNTRAAISCALNLARMTRAVVTAMCVNDTVCTCTLAGKYTPQDIVSPVEQECLTAVNKVVDQGEKMGVDVTPLVVDGIPIKEIVDASSRYDLIVMGTAARTGVSLLLLGSVAQHVIRFSSCPVLIISSVHPVGLECHRILIPTDGNDNTRAAIRYGLEMAGIFNADVTALSVSSVKRGPLPRGREHEHFPPEAGQKAVDYVVNEGRKFGIAVEPTIVTGSPATEIIRASGQQDLIVMGTNGRTGLEYLRLGSVAEKTVRHARCPVLVVRAVEPVLSQR